MLRCTVTKAGIVEYQEIPTEIERGQPLPTLIAPTAALQNAPN
jgi:hypothetical protein